MSNPLEGLCALLVFFCALPAIAQDAPGGETRTKESMMTKASGTFEVKMSPVPPAEGENPQIGRMTLNKRFSGDLEGTSQGQMLAFRTPVEGSAGYVAMEQVTGTLEGRTGTFVLQHSGTMSRGEQHLQLRVVPDSGTGELVGLSGSMTILVEAGNHLFEFEYVLPEDPQN